MILYDIPYPSAGGSYGVTVAFTAGDPMTVFSKESVIQIEVESGEYCYAAPLTADQARKIATALIAAAELKEQAK